MSLSPTRRTLFRRARVAIGVILAMAGGYLQYRAYTRDADWWADSPEMVAELRDLRAQLGDAPQAVRAAERSARDVRAALDRLPPGPDAQAAEVKLIELEGAVELRRAEVGLATLRLQELAEPLEQRRGLWKTVGMTLTLLGLMSIVATATPSRSGRL